MLVAVSIHESVAVRAVHAIDAVWAVVVHLFLLRNRLLGDDFRETL
jgi:hypothetical protein